MEAIDHDLEKLQIMHRVKNDPWEFAKYCYTLDEADDKGNSKKLFPAEELLYIKFIFRLLQMEKRILLPKSRRMKITWCVSIYILWLAMFKQGRHIAVMSKKEDDADVVIEKRILFIYNNLHPDIPREMLPKAKYTFCHLEFKEMNSEIHGFPQGADQLRQHTISLLFADELAFWDKAKDTWSAAKPTLDGGGAFIGVSSQAPGFFEDMVKDQIDIDKLIQQRDNTTPTRKSPMQGVNIWRNKNNKFLVMELHYTADPAKRSPEYKASIKEGIPYKDYMMEYELSWEKFAGLPVFTDFSKQIHAVPERLYPWFGLPLLIGFDFGLTPAAVVCQLQVNQLVLLKEFVAINMGIDRFLDLVTPELRTLYPGWSDFKKDFLCFIDPAGFAKKDTDMRTCAMSLDDAGFSPMPGAIAWAERKKSVEKFLTNIYGGLPAFKMSEYDCPIMLRGFEGGYQYDEGEDKLEKSGKVRPLKNEFSHPHDALQMVTSMVTKIQIKQKKACPPPSYSFSKAR